MGHTNADLTLSVYTQVVDGALRTATDRSGSENCSRLFTKQKQVGAKSLI